MLIFFICQKQKLTKPEYNHNLAASKIAFSAALQETCGISICIEAPLVNCIPFAPNRLSYAEILKDFPEFLYPSQWTLSWDHYVWHRGYIIERIGYILDHFNDFMEPLERFKKTRLKQYAYPKKLLENLMRS